MNPKIAVIETSKRKKTLERALRLPGVEIVRTTTAEGALKILSEGGVDLIVLDIAMPDVEGVELLHALKKATKSSALPMLVVSQGCLHGREIGDTIRRFVMRKLGRPGAPPTPELQRAKWRSIGIEEIAKGMDVSRAKLAQMIDISERNLARWITGETKPRGHRDSLLQRLKYLYYLLTRALKEEAIPKYLREPNPALGGRTPLSALQAGDFNSIEADLQQLIEGVYV